jgi:hypothetical protein
VLATRLREVESGDRNGGLEADQRRADIALLTAQLLATGFEVTCARAATSRS